VSAAFFQLIFVHKVGGFLPVSLRLANADAGHSPFGETAPKPEMRLLSNNARKRASTPLVDLLIVVERTLGVFSQGGIAIMF
jgi:hypothetical protein